MTWQPITVGEAEIRAFAINVAAFERGLDTAQRRLWREVILRAGGRLGHASHRGRTAEKHERAPKVSDAGSAGVRFALEEVWEPDTTIAPLYSGAMPAEGGGTLD